MPVERGEQARQRVRDPHGVLRLERLQAVDRRSGGYEHRAVLTQAPSRSKHEVSLVEIAGGVGAGPHRLAKPGGRALHPPPVYDEHGPAALRALRQPRQRRPRGFQRELEPHSWRIHRDNETAAGARLRPFERRTRSTSPLRKPSAKLKCSTGNTRVKASAVLMPCVRALSPAQATAAAR